MGLGGVDKNRVRATHSIVHDIGTVMTSKRVQNSQPKGKSAGGRSETVERERQRRFGRTNCTYRRLAERRAPFASMVASKM